MVQLGLPQFEVSLLILGVSGPIDSGRQNWRPLRSVVSKPRAEMVPLPYLKQTFRVPENGWKMEVDSFPFGIWISWMDLAYFCWKLLLLVLGNATNKCSHHVVAMSLPWLFGWLCKASKPIAKDPSIFGNARYRQKTDVEPEHDLL